MTPWLSRKTRVPPLCARRGCWSPPFDGDDNDPEASCLCRKHRDEHREANRRSMNRRRCGERVQLKLGW